MPYGVDEITPATGASPRMQQTMQAAIGALALNSTQQPPGADAPLSITLAGAAAGGTPGAGPVNPIAAARAWLANPVRVRALPTTLLIRAASSVDVAEAHMHVLDELATAVAAELRTVGTVETARLAQVDSMLDVLNTFSLRMRELLDPESPAPDADVRLQAGLEAARDGGLPALVAAL
jgi:hypothetical protein